MKYLIFSEISSQIYGKHIIGLAENKNEVFSLLSDFYNYLKISENNTFESSWLTYFNVFIYKITNEDYLTIEKIIDNHSDIINDMKWKYDKNIENFFNNFIFIPIEYPECIDDVFLSEDEIDKINKIIANGVNMFD